MVVSGVEAVSGDKGHRGEITGGDPMVIGFVTDAGIERDNTRVTQGDAEAGTGEEIEDATLRRPDRVLVGCKDMAPT